MIGVPSLQIRKASERPQVYDCGSSVKYDPARPDDYPAARVFAKLENLHGKTFDHGLGDGHASERLVSDLVERVVNGTLRGTGGELAYRCVPLVSRGRLAGSMSSTPAPLEPDAVWPSLATVVPVYNEEAGIDFSIRTIVAVVERYPGRACVIAVDDGSSDRSGTVLVDLEGELDRLELCTHKSNAGYGAAIRTGAQRASALGFEYVAFIDSDLTNPPDDLLKIGELASHGHSYIKGSRFLTGGGMRIGPIPAADLLGGGERHRPDLVRNPAP